MALRLQGVDGSAEKIFSRRERSSFCHLRRRDETPSLSSQKTVHADHRSQALVWSLSDHFLSKPEEPDFFAVKVATIGHNADCDIAMIWATDQHADADASIADDITRPSERCSTSTWRGIEHSRITCTLSLHLACGGRHMTVAIRLRDKLLSRFCCCRIHALVTTCLPRTIDDPWRRKSLSFIH